MKTLINIANPFVLLLIPVFFAVILGAGYQFQKQTSSQAYTETVSDSVFIKKTSLFRSTCQLFKEVVW